MTSALITSLATLHAKRVRAIWLLCGGLVAVVLTTLVVAIPVARAVGISARAVLAGGFAIAALMTLVVCILATWDAYPARLGKPYDALRWVIVVLAWAAPAGAVLALRMSKTQCVVMNVFGLPWPPEVKTLVWVAGATLVALSTTALILASVTPRLRSTARTMWIHSAISFLPGMWVLFFAVYGDPAANCVPM